MSPQDLPSTKIVHQVPPDKRVSTSKVVQIGRNEEGIGHLVRELDDIRANIRANFELLTDVKLRLTVLENNQKFMRVMCGFVVSSILLPAAWIVFKLIAERLQI